MIGALVDGIVAALRRGFGYPVYTETVRQGLEAPCFSVLCVSPAQEQVIGRRYLRRHLFCVYYFPSDTGGRAELDAVYEALLGLLEYISVEGDLLRGTRMAAGTEDGVLVFRVHYDFHVRAAGGEAPVMEDHTLHYGL